ncbi:MAG TPA: hypothetical protein VE666_15310 [Mycobacterium sp.]|nr:hypothetical protein [Mycobacterium sp.]
MADPGVEAQGLGVAVGARRRGGRRTDVQHSGFVLSPIATRLTLAADR